jgi:MoxR-like ATPase
MLNNKQREFVKYAYGLFNKDVLTKSELIQANKKFGCKYAPQWLIKNKDYKVDKATFKLPLDGDIKKTAVVKTTDTTIETKKEAAYIVSSLTGDIVPKKDPVFVPFGNYTDIKSIIKSNKFYPVFVTGLSGNGKTMSILQACADNRKECIRVNVTIETDEDDLLGGYRLRDGQTVWQNGPVIEAMERGALLLLDEIDLASNKIMCLQPILEGSGVFVKKINKFVKPKEGFNVIATANTKGQGSEDGKFIGTNILNEAFLERFPVTFEQKYPNAKTEEKILNNTLEAAGKKDADYVSKLVTWADVIRKTYFDGGVDEIISTRRLVHIVQAYAIFKNKLKAIEMCTNRFDEDTKTSFVDLYTKVDAGATADQIIESNRQAEVSAQTETNSNDGEEEQVAI